LLNSISDRKKICIINISTTIEHDTIVGDNVHIRPGAVLSGGVTVGTNSFIGAGAIIIQKTNITANTLIGAGAVVIKDVTSSGVYVGTPAKKTKDL